VTQSFFHTTMIHGMVHKMELKEAKDKAYKLVVENLREWYDIIAFGEPIIKSSDSGKTGDIQMYILHGYVEVEFKAGWQTSAREHSRSGRVLFTVKLNADNGKILSLKHKEKL
jgi:hypothetical protein